MKKGPKKPTPHVAPRIPEHIAPDAPESIVVVEDEEVLFTEDRPQGLHDDTSRPEPLSEPVSNAEEPVQEDLSVACAALGLSIEHVLTHAIRADGSVSIITLGGKRLTWPCSDEARQAAIQLTGQERDGRIRDHDGTILPPGKWLTTPHKF